MLDHLFLWRPIETLPANELVMIRYGSEMFVGTLRAIPRNARKAQWTPVQVEACRD